MSGEPGECEGCAFYPHRFVQAEDPRIAELEARLAAANKRYEEECQGDNAAAHWVSKRVYDAAIKDAEQRTAEAIADWLAADICPIPVFDDDPRDIRHRVQDRQLVAEITRRGDWKNTP